MPDKEFDNLFRETFKDAEMEPSANLWASIEKELEPKRKKTIPLLWMAAAAVTITVSAMLVFQEKEVVRLQGAQDPTVAVEKPAVVTPDQPTDITAARSVEPMELAAKPVVRTIQVKQDVSVGVDSEPQKNIQVAVQPINNPDRLAIKPMEPKPLNVTPIEEVVVAENPIVVANHPVKDEVEMISESNTERKGIRNVGDLVNYVVDKVDKREKKLVRFNTDDDNSSIIGINIGFLKFNKKNR